MAEVLLRRELPRGPFRLIGVGIGALEQMQGRDESMLFADQSATNADAERASDQIRSKFGKDAIQRGRALLGRRAILVE